MTYITYSYICVNLVRNCLKEPYKVEALSHEKVYFSISKWTDGKPEKPVCNSVKVMWFFREKLPAFKVKAEFLKVVIEDAKPEELEMTNKVVEEEDW